MRNRQSGMLHNECVNWNWHSLRDRYTHTESENESLPTLCGASHLHFFFAISICAVCSGCKWMFFFGGHNNFKRSVQSQQFTSQISCEWRCKYPSTQNKTDLLQNRTKYWERQIFSSWCCLWLFCVTFFCTINDCSLLSLMVFVDQK